MTSSTSIILDGVEFKLSEELKIKPGINFSVNTQIKDVANLMKAYNYDFSLEKNVISLHLIKQREIEERKRRKEEMERLKASDSIDKESAANNGQGKASKNQTGSGSSDASNNPFANDIFSTAILTPQQYINANIGDSPQHHSLDVREFVDENQDPFSNAELQTIDDLKELKDVLQNVTMGGMPGTSSVSKSVTRIRQHSPTAELNGITSKMSKQEGSHSPTIIAGTTSPIDLDRSSPNSQQKSEISALSPATFASSTVALTVPAVSPVSSVTSARSSSPLFVLPPVSPSDQKSTGSVEKSTSATNSNVLPSGANNTIDDTPTGDPVSALAGKFRTIDSPPPMETDTGNYVNVSISDKPKVLPKPRSRLNNDAGAPPSNSISKETASVSQPNNTLQHKFFANKSKEERAKFEETINKALTSLPTLPQNVVLPKVLPNTNKPNNTRIKPNAAATSSILSGFSPDERDFAEPIVAMGFKEEDVLRAMQKYGQDHKEILDRLIKVQDLSEKGFASQHIDEALDLFQENVDEVEKYLTLQRQFLDMGFSCSKIKQALLLHNTDQNKALEELMSGV